MANPDPPAPPIGPSFDRRAIPPRAREAVWRAPGGAAIRRIDWAGAAGGPGSILFLPGRGDAYEKYLETLAHWAANGWAVTASDWRGQAGSGRLGRDATTGHVADFGVWVDDLAALWLDWTAQRPGPHVLVGHSMGGHLALRAVAEGRIAPAALVLSAPMLGLRTPVPRMVQRAVAQAMAAAGDPRRAAWQTGEAPGALPTRRAALLTHDAARYADELWWRGRRPELAMGPGSWGWIAAALASMRDLARPAVLGRVRAPVLMLATSADRLVDYGAIARAARALPRCRLVRWGAESRHEILREADPVRDWALAEIDAFLGRLTPGGA